LAGVLSLGASATGPPCARGWWSSGRAISIRRRCFGPSSPAPGPGWRSAAHGGDPDVPDTHDGSTRRRFGSTADPADNQRTRERMTTSARQRPEQGAWHIMLQPGVVAEQSSGANSRRGVARDDGLSRGVRASAQPSTCRRRPPDLQEQDVRWLRSLQTCLPAEHRPAARPRNREGPALASAAYRMAPATVTFHRYRAARPSSW
jgi:hypothetical protein